MEALLIEVAKQVPALMVLGWVVWLFTKLVTGFHKTLGSVADDCHEHSTRLTERYHEDREEMTDLTRHNLELMGEVRGLLRKLNGNHK